MTHYFNEYFDYEADLANKQRGKWNGGSGVLPEGLLPPWVALAAGNVFLIGSIVTLAFLRTPAQYVACATVFLSWGYTGPPFKLHYRGLGEVVVAIVLTWCVPVMGALQRRGDGAFLLPTSLRTIIPLLFVQQFVRMMVMNLPDIESDLQCGKITLTAQMGPSGRHDSSNTFDGLDDFYNWLNTSIIQPSLLCIKARTLIGSCAPHCPPLSPPPLQKLWVDPTCGSGTCDRPFQYPAFGRFGCEADCGIFPSLTSIVIRLSSQLDTQQAADESSWNLCMVNPVSLCWYARPPPAALIFLLSPSCVLIPPYATPCMSAMRCGAIRYEEFQPFRVGDTEVSVALDIPDGDWVVVLNAPAGGIRGTVHAPPPGMRRFSVVGAASTIELAAWGYCTHDDDVDAANQALPSGGAGGSPPDVCRDTCARLVLCLPATCGRAFTEREVAGTFVDCARMCIVAPSSITTYADTPCPMEQLRHLHPRRRLYPHRYSDWTSSALPTDAPPAFVSLAASAVSADAAPVALLALPVQGAPGAAVAALPPPAAARAVAAAAAAVAAMAAAGTAATADPTQPSLWSLLGATDRQRLTALQVAVSRALFTMAKDRCLAGRAPGAEARVAAGASNHTHGGLGSVRWRMVTCFCTMLGGPVTTLDECRFMDEAGQLVVEGGEMYAYLQRTHVSGGRMISAQHMRRFMQTMVAALRSVTPMPDAAAARLNTLMHSFNDAIVTSDSVGCAQGGAWLQWRAGVSHNTTIHVGDKVTWVWDDDLPHLLAGMGEAGDPLFVGFGGNRLAVSRQIACTPMNVGAGVMRDDPVPCVLRECPPHAMVRMDDEPLGSFAYSKVFGEPITIHYTDGSLAGTAGDAVSSSASPSSSPTPTSMSASILTVLPARAGADATGCRLQRLANGVCDSPCNTPACAFDGGDYACVDPLFGPGICACPPGHTRRDDGCQSPVSPLHSTLSPPALLHRASLLSCSHFTLALPSYSLFLISLPFLVSVPPLSPPACCLSTAVGANLNFPFSLQRYGPNYTERNYVFAAERGFAATRYVSRRNRLLIGMVLQQDRWGTQQCSRAGLLHLGGWCSNGTSTEPFGVNPHFLPTSAIYDSAASANMSQLDNNTFGFKLKFNPQGLPYGFIYPMNEAATRRLHYLVDGSYIDNGTRSIDVNFITFNGETLTFVLTTVRCTMNEGGSMAVTFKSQPAAMAMYDASAENIARLVLEIIYLVGLLWNVVVLWRYVSTFDMQPRYNIYYSLFEAPRYWAVPNPPTGFIRATQVFADLRNIINLRAVYFALQGINVFFMMIRLLKVMDFQPYLGVITRSLGLATPSLMHFFLLSFTVFFCFSMYGYLVFGGTMELENPRKRRFKSIQRRVTAMLSGTRGSAADKATPFPRSDNQPTFPSAASESRVWKQHVLTVRDKRIDVISLAMILQRHHDHAAKKAPATSSSGACLVSWNAEEDRLEQLSQAVVLQCGEVVKQAALPVKKPVQKLSLAHVQVRGEGEGCMWRCARTREEVVRCQAGVEELRGMMADMQSDMRAMMALLDRALPASRAHTPRVSRS
ncbi:unnamed protein product [Closterium sp. NIES-64]|nr:unnamed protein product [Closterium sp. NIES-64]